jgi:hypothetical protein
MSDWIYILNPEKNTLDGEPSTRATLLKQAKSRTPHEDWWLSQRNKMVPGDKLWIYVGGEEAAVVAVAEVDQEPRPAPAGAPRPYLVAATLLRSGTEALSAAPVKREDLALGQVRSVQKVKLQVLQALLDRSGL